MRISDWSSDVCSSDLFDEVVGLQDHVVEFEEAERLLALQPQLHGVEAEHAVDREMPAVVAQEVDILQLVDPVGIIGHHGIARSLAEPQEPGKGDRKSTRLNSSP